MDPELEIQKLSAKLSHLTVKLAGEIGDVMRLVDSMKLQDARNYLSDASSTIDDMMTEVDNLLKPEMERD